MYRINTTKNYYIKENLFDLFQNKVMILIV